MSIGYLIGGSVVKEKAGLRRLATRGATRITTVKVVLPANSFQTLRRVRRTVLFQGWA